MRPVGSLLRPVMAGLWVSAALTGFAGAAELSREQLSHAEADEHCAAFGPGYVRVEGTEACARIGERMRVEMNVPRPPPFLGAFPPPFELDMSQDGPARARLRLDGPPPPRDPNRTLSR